MPNQWVWANPYQAEGNGSGTNTDASGVFTLGVTAGDWYVATRFSGYTLQSTPRVALGYGEILTDVDLLLWPHNATVAGGVLDQDGNPVDGADVIIRDGVTGDWLQDSTRSDDSGYYTMPVAAGTWKIRAEKYGYISSPDQEFIVGTGVTVTKYLVLQAKGSCTDVSGADFTYTPLAPLVGELVTLTGTVAGGTPPITYTWGFGDGGTGSGQVVAHTFPLTTTMKTYMVTMTSTNACPSMLTWAEAVTVRPRAIYLPLVLRSFAAAGVVSQ